MLNVGSTVSGLNSFSLQQKRLRSFSCLFDAKTHSGSPPTLTSRTKAVFLFLLWRLLALSRRYHGSSIRPSPDMFFCIPEGCGVLLRLRFKSLACCRLLGTWPTPAQDLSPLKSSLKSSLYHTVRSCVYPVDTMTTAIRSIVDSTARFISMAIATASDHLFHNDLWKGNISF